MIHDPSTAWDGPFPYEVLAPAGADPDTPHAEMQDLSFELMARGLMTPRTQRAWHELRTTRRRLLADVLLYAQEAGPEAVAAAREAAEAEEAAEDAEPDVPPEAEEWLRPPWAPAERLADELDGVPLPPFPGPPPEPLDALVRFDR
ncbi:hypothetical protein [Streptomyces albiaxialis]